jgi:phenylalanyl-tRNA synthetase alpha chain
MLQQIEKIQKEFSIEIEKIKNSSELETIKVKFLGKKGPVQQLLKDLKNTSQEERPYFGKCINDLRVNLEERTSKIEAAFVLKEENERLIAEKIDETLPGRNRYIGRKHIITQALDEILDILIGMGFSVEYGPEVDTDYYNFEALNFPADHPARDMQDTFYISSDVLLRTHTSNIQARVMESYKPPIRIVAPGKAYRNESISARSHVFFHQFEGFYIDKNVTFADLISTLEEFYQKLFKRPIEVRFRPSYFPFVEPGMEVDIRCEACNGNGCNLCKHTGWLEVAGAGMIHPEVLRNGGIDPEEYSGFAWGGGVERLVLLKYGVNDIRMFTENDLRFLDQFSAV